MQLTCKQPQIPANLGKFACNVPRNCSATLLEFYPQQNFLGSSTYKLHEKIAGRIT